MYDAFARGEPKEPSEMRVHGGALDAELRALGASPREVLDFSANINPYGPCPAVVEAVRNAALDRYPDPTGRNARELMAPTLGVSADGIVLGNGAAELLWTLARVFLPPGSTALVVEPTFCEFRMACASAQAHVIEWRANEGDGFALDLEEVRRRAFAHKVRVVYLASPNTPTATAIDAARIARWAESSPQLIAVLDQSFLSLSTRFPDAKVGMPPNVVCVRSLTKDHALPGLRVGYAIATPTLAAEMEKQRPAWTTSTLAQAAAVAACSQACFVEASRRRLLNDRDRLRFRLRDLGLEPFDSETTFFLVRVKRATELRRRLLARHRILVRDCTSFGLPEFVRIAARPEPDCDRLITALEEEILQC